MSNLIIPLNAFDHDEVLKKGQAHFIHIVAESGATGVEIRRELLPNGFTPSLHQNLKDIIENYHLFTVYSAPIETWQKDGTLNIDSLQQVFKESKLLGAKWIKVSLGYYRNHVSDIKLLKSFLAQQGDSINLLIENDQTTYGGNIQSLREFFENASLYEVNVKMTFDIGNWSYVKEDIQVAVDNLKDYVGYLHLKHVEKRDGALITLPLPQSKDASWRKIILHFPSSLPKALEFPINPYEKVTEYINFMKVESE